MAESARVRVVEALALVGRGGCGFDELMVQSAYEGRAIAFERLLKNLERHGAINQVGGRWFDAAKSAKRKPKPKKVVSKHAVKPVVDVEVPGDEVGVEQTVDESRKPRVDIVFESAEPAEPFGLMPLVLLDRVREDLSFLEVMARNFEASAADVRAVAHDLRLLARQAGVLRD